MFWPLLSSRHISSSTPDSPGSFVPPERKCYQFLQLTEMIRRRMISIYECQKDIIFTTCRSLTVRSRLVAFISVFFSRAVSLAISASWRNRITRHCSIVKGLLKKSRQPGPLRCCRSPCWPLQASPLHALSAGHTAVVSKVCNSSRSQRFKLDITCNNAWGSQLSAMPYLHTLYIHPSSQSIDVLKPGPDSSISFCTRQHSAWAALHSSWSLPPPKDRNKAETKKDFYPPRPAWFAHIFCERLQRPPPHSAKKINQLWLKKKAPRCTAPPIFS